MHDILIAINIETKPTDDIDILLDSRRALKDYYNLEKKDWIDVDEEFYKRNNQAFYLCNDNQDFVLVIYGSETRGKVSQNYTFLIKTKANEAADLKRKYQRYSFIPNYTTYSLDELEKMSREKQRQEEITKQQQKKEAKKKQTIESFMGGVSGCYFGLGIINGDKTGGFCDFDFSLKVYGPLSFGIDWRAIGNMVENKDEEWKMRMDLDAYLSLGLAIPISYNPPIIFGAVAVGLYLYEKPDTSYTYIENTTLEDDTFYEFRAGIQFQLPGNSTPEIKLVYSKEYTKQNGDLDIFTILLGGRF